MLKKLLNKIHSKKGASLAEMLICVLILLLASGTLVTGISLASNNFEKSFSNSQAQSIASTLMAAVQGELRYTKTIEFTKGAGYVNPSDDTAGGGPVLDFKYSSPEFDIMGYFSNDDSGRVVIANVDTTAEIQGFELLAKGTYSHKLKATVTVNSVKDKLVGGKTEVTCMNVTVNITREGSSDIVETSNFDVVPIGHPKATVHES